MNDQAISTLRTIVAALVGAVAARLARWGVSIDPTVLTVALIAAYHAIASTAQRRWPNRWTRHLLGVGRPPNYPRPNRS